ncbi:MAG: bifunctional glutamate N-acetyltransferase/amino-acid acetyltransferase ArgJ [Hyphomicrobiaceae bacterium]|nr:bifunctional glutamate N-acetyltransferase/amino-acid acetyltransferase ArgJ [Hyphomicrobiaceae bacterium]
MGNSTAVSPFAPEKLARLAPIDGVRFATAEAGIRYKGRTDLMVAVMDEGTVAAGVLTQSKTCSAPVVLCRENLAKSGKARILVVNSGNANAFTGMKGREAVEATVSAAAAAAGCKPAEVYVSSTGVIGEPMDAGKFTHLLAGLAKKAKANAFEAAARAIMTTDTYPKVATAKVDLGDGVKITINGICKGAGMIAPDMATMLCYIFTDAALAQKPLQALVSEHVETTFNCMTIDGDTSTSDTCLVFATGAAKARGQEPITRKSDKRLAAFGEALKKVMRDLAIQIAKDGEGLSKFVTFEITGAESFKAARTIARACGNSPILKTAIAGEDPNWGRVVMAVGKSGEAADRDKLTIWFGPYCVARDGERAAEYDEKTVAQYMKGREIVIRADVGVGKASATVWTCDLTHDYVSINADYRS